MRVVSGGGRGGRGGHSHPPPRTCGHGPARPARQEGGADNDAPRRRSGRRGAAPRAFAWASWGVAACLRAWPCGLPARACVPARCLATLLSCEGCAAFNLLPAFMACFIRPRPLMRRSPLTLILSLLSSRSPLSFSLCLILSPFFPLPCPGLPPPTPPVHSPLSLALRPSSLSLARAVFASPPHFSLSVRRLRSPPLSGYS